MKDSKRIKKILYLGKTDIALIVTNTVDEKHNILFADQLEVDSANLQPKISQLLTDAANWLGFNIKEVEIVFDDDQITRYSFTEQEFVDCNSEEDIAKEIFKKAKIDNYFVNEINFLGISYDDIDKVAKVNCEICASDYITYKKYIKAVRACNVMVTNSTNLYRLLKTNKEDIELTIKIIGNKAIACEYYGCKLNNVKVIDLKMDNIKQLLANKFAISPNKVDDVLAIANELVLADDLETLVVNNYTLQTKTYNQVKAIDLVTLYRDEIRNEINKYVDFRLFQHICVVSPLAINQLPDFDFFSTDDIFGQNVSLDKVLCLANIGTNPEITQFSFENKIDPVELLA